MGKQASSVGLASARSLVIDLQVSKLSVCTLLRNPSLIETVPKKKLNFRLLESTVNKIMVTEKESLYTSCLLYRNTIVHTPLRLFLTGLYVLLKNMLEMERRVGVDSVKQKVC